MTSNCTAAAHTAYEAKGDYDKAIADENRVVTEKPGYAQGYCLRGLTYERKGDHNKAILDLNIAIRLDPMNVEAHAARAAAYEKKGDKAKAAADRAMAETFRKEQVGRGIVVLPDLMEKVGELPPMDFLGPSTAPSGGADPQKHRKDSPLVPAELEKLLKDASAAPK